MIRSKTKKLFSLLLAVSLIGTLAAPKIAEAAEATVTAGSTSNFAILSGETITNTGRTEVTGDIGLHPGTEVPGKDDVILTGEWHITDGVSLTAKNDLVTAYNDAAGRTPQIISRELGGQTLSPGVYTSNEKDFQLNGTLILDGEGDPDAVFIFQTDSTLITGSASSVVLTNEATPCGVFWKIGSSATLGSYSNFAGRILALTSITLETGAEVKGQLLARNGAVTLDSNKIVSGKCETEKDTTATLHVIKQVVNEAGETAVAEDFSIHVLKDGIDVEGSPYAGIGSPGRPYTLEAGTYTVTEAPVEGYSAVYSGDSSDGTITLAAGDHKTVIITNSRTNSSITGHIEVEKYDEEGNRLSGAEFTLFSDDVQIGEPKVTDKNGTLTFTGLTKGMYTLKETKAPDGYVLKDTVYDVEIMEDNETVVVSVTNDRIIGQISIIKVDNQTGEVLSGAEFTLYKEDIQIGEPLLTDENGNVIFTELPAGVYTVIETKAPAGYVPSNIIEEVEISEDNETVVVNITNRKIMGLITITKLDAKTGKVLEGAEFEITDEKGNVLFKGKTDKNGKLSSEASFGKYVITEITAPENYIKSERKYSVDVTEDGQKFNLEVKNDKRPDQVPVLPKAGDQASASFLFMGIFAIAFGAMLLRKRSTAK